MPVLHLPQRRYLLLTLLLGVAAVVGVLFPAFWHTRVPQFVAPQIRTAYSGSYTNTIGGLQPSSGHAFLVVHLTVTNMGYQNFTANPFRDMYVIVGGQAYNVSAAYAFLVNPFPPSNLKNSETASGEVVFEVPQGTNSFTPQWRLPSGQDIHLNWVPS